MRQSVLPLTRSSASACARFLFFLSCLLVLAVVLVLLLSLVVVPFLLVRGKKDKLTQHPQIFPVGNG